jgi:hypothetical protein
VSAVGIDSETGAVEACVIAVGYTSGLSRIMYIITTTIIALFISEVVVKVYECITD